MANPRTRKNLRFLPEDAGHSHLSEAWQAERWLKELDSSLGTPMIRAFNQDFYVHEPVLLRNGRTCVPMRWYNKMEQPGEYFTNVHPLNCVSEDTTTGWVIDGSQSYEVCVNDIQFALPSFVAVHASRRLPDPHNVVGQYAHQAL